MRFLVRMNERSPRDAQENSAMLLHRLESLRYQADLLASGCLAYAFRAELGSVTVMMFEVDSLTDLDRYLKRDPGWPYCATEVIPVVSTEALIREAQDYLGEFIFAEEELQHLDYVKKPINSDCQYWLAIKEVLPFSPLLSEDAQNDVHRRTVLAQRSHLNPVEFADDNPVGRAVGILVAEGDLESTKKHVESCEVFPDTIVTYLELSPLPRAWTATVAEIGRLRPDLTQRLTDKME